MPLDPIVSLSVALAEAPGTCAFFLGSGVSRDADVPTGWEVMRAGLHRLRQLETSSSEQVDEDALDTWLAETGRGEITYSELLELIAPDAAVRREYLAGFFEGATPGPTHERLADLAVRGLVRVFVTTNFDRLLEHALQARGIEPVVIASDADLSATMPREHAACLVLKPHGDYLRQTIRNTPEELASLEPAVTRELVEIFDRYGIVVLGYSGADEAIAAALRERRSRYGLWWVARGELSQPAAELVEAAGGRVIHRDSAAEFLADLDARLAVFEAHPSGHTPAMVHDQTLAFLRANDRIGLDEHLRREAHTWEAELARVTAEVINSHPQDTDRVREIWQVVLPHLERRVASLLPLALHEPECFEVEVQRLARGLEQRQVVGGYTAWIELPEYLVTWLGYVIGALLVRLERYEQLRPLIHQTWSDRHGSAERLIWLPGETQNIFGVALAEEGVRWLSPGWEHLSGSTGGFRWLEERYPELFADGEPRRSMAQFDLLLAIHHGLTDHRAAAFFSLGGGSASEFALRLNSDERLRGRIADVLGVTLEDFDARAPDAVRAAAPFQGGLSDYNVAGILEHGRSAT